MEGLPQNLLNLLKDHLMHTDKYWVTQYIPLENIYLLLYCDSVVIYYRILEILLLSKHIESLL